MWSLVMYSICLEQNILKEQMVINLFATLLLKVPLYRKKADYQEGQ